MRQPSPNLVPRPFAPALVACSTNVRECLAILVTCSDIPEHYVGGRVEDWHIPRIPQVSECATEHSCGPCNKQLISGSHNNISSVQKAYQQLYRRKMWLVHMSTQRPGMSLHMVTFTRPSRINTVSDMASGKRAPTEKAV